MARKARNAKSDVLTKTCTKSGETFTGTFEELTEFFYRDKTQKDGLSPWSKAAERAYNRAYYTGLKKAKAQKKSVIEDEKSLKVFEREMKSERVARARKASSRAQSPAVVTKKRQRRSTKKAQA